MHRRPTFPFVSSAGCCTSANDLGFNVCGSKPATTVVFGFTGGIQTYTVPAGVNTVFVKCWGAAGGAGYNSAGGAGGYSEGRVAVRAGETLYVAVGQGGTINQLNNNNQRINGGGGGLSGVFSSWQTSDVDTTHASAIIVAGAGGGGGYAAGHHGGCGGGSQGGATKTHQRPGTPTAGGVVVRPNGGSIGSSGAKLRGGYGGGG